MMLLDMVEREAEAVAWQLITSPSTDVALDLRISPSHGFEACKENLQSSSNPKVSKALWSRLQPV